MAPISPDPSEVLSTAYQEYARALLRHCCFRRFRQEDAEEIVQETFARTWEYLTAGKQIQNLKVFLYQVVNNLIVDRVRKRKGREEVSLDALQEIGFDIGQDRTEKLQRRLDMRTVLLKFRELERREHDLLVMRYIDELMPAEIAVIMDLPVNTVSVRLHRALKKLSSYLEYGGVRALGGA
jgi:RNA polymerase sigma-70 factor (ECF subfamily)